MYGKLIVKKYYEGVRKYISKKVYYYNIKLSTTANRLRNKITKLRLYDIGIKYNHILQKQNRFAKMIFCESVLYFALSKNIVVSSHFSQFLYIPIFIQQ